MSFIDWVILIAVLTTIIIYGVYKGRGQTGADSYLRAGKELPWHVVLLGIMATQASAITFISGPGQAYSDGMRFVQYYFGLPLAMIVVSAVFVPIFQKLNVYTAYEYLDKRFDRRTRIFTGILFLFSRGISTGMSIYAPAIVLSAIFNWNIFFCNVLVGGLLIIYTYSGGAKAIAHTQKVQFIIIMSAMIMAAIVIIVKLPPGVSLSDALYIAGKSNKLNVITTNFDWKDKYNIWSGVIGGFFLALSYFGTDQSQVGRYLTGKNIRESRLGLLMNGLVKIPMQFFILLIGALLFAFYTIQKPPLVFNEKAETLVAQAAPEQYKSLLIAHKIAADAQQNLALYLTGLRNADVPNKEAVQALYLKRFQSTQALMEQQRKEMQQIIEEKNIAVEKKDVNYVFLHFVKHYLPVGMVGLLFAIVFLASWGSISAALNALASSTLIDFHLLLSNKKTSDGYQLKWGKFYTLLWGLFSIAVAMFATKLGSLIEAVNELGSLFYGAILGVFLTAFFLKKIKGKSVFWAAIIAEIVVLIFYNAEKLFALTQVSIFEKMSVGFLWLNVIGALCVLIFSTLIQWSLKSKTQKENA